MHALKAYDDQFSILEDVRENTVTAPVNAAFGAAVTRLIELHLEGKEFRAEAEGKVSEALEGISAQLHRYGISYAMAESMIQQIDEMFQEEAMAFLSKKKSPQLAIKMMVTDRAPDIEPSDKAVRVLVFDGMTKFSGAGGGMGMANTINGTTTTEFDTPDFEEIFTAGRKYVLVVSLEKNVSATLNGMDAVALNSALAQIAGAVASPEAFEEITQAIEAGEIEPAVADLIETMAELAALQTIAQDAAAPADIQATIETMQAKVAEQIADMKDVPPALAQAAMSALEGNGANIITLGTLNNPVSESIVPDNDNQAAPAEISETKSLNEAMDLAADVSLDLSVSEKSALLEILDVAEIPAALKDKMIASVEAGEFTVDDFKVVTARIENPADVQAIADMAQKVEATAREFAADVERAIPPVTLSGPLAALIADTIQDLPDMPALQKTELVQFIKEGPLPAPHVTAVVAAIAPSQPRIATAIVREQATQAVQAQTIKVEGGTSRMAQTPVVQTPQQGGIPSRTGDVAVKADTPQNPKRAVEVLNTLQGKKLDADSNVRDVRGEVQAIRNMLDQESRKQTPETQGNPELARKVLDNFLTKTPNPTIQDFRRMLSAMPEGDVRTNIVNTAIKYERIKQSEVGVKNPNMESVMRTMDDIAKGLPPAVEAELREIQLKTLLNEPIPADEFNKLYEKLPPEKRDQIAEIADYKKGESIVKGMCEECDKGRTPGACEACRGSFKEEGSKILADLRGGRKEVTINIVNDAPKGLGNSFQSANNAADAGGNIDQSPNNKKSSFFKRFGLG